MPALVTHYIFATETAAHAASPLAEIISADNDAFLWGAQGPDILFFHHPLRKNTVSRLGHAMHDRYIAHTFSVLAQECARHNNPSAAAYLLGFCCHYALDRTVHPFVTYLVQYRLDPQYPTLSYSSLHHLCESEMDRTLIVDRGLRVPNSGKHGAALPAHRLLTYSPQVRDAAAQLLSAAARETYGVRLSSRQVTRSMRSMLQITHALQNPTGRRASRVAALEKMFHSEGMFSSLMRPYAPLPVDCTNRNHAAWTDAATPHLRRYESFPDLMKRAEQTALRLMDCSCQAVQHGTRLPPELFSLNYLGLTEWR